MYDCTCLRLTKVHDRAGNLTYAEGDRHLPFPLRRVYYLYDVPGGESRGGHAHRNLYQCVVAASGAFDVLLDDGENKKVVTLNRPYFGLLIVPGIWRELLEFSSGSVCLVLASEKYEEADYFRDYDTFRRYKRGES